MMKSNASVIAANRAIFVRIGMAGVNFIPCPACSVDSVQHGDVYGGGAGSCLGFKASTGTPSHVAACFRSRNART